MSETHENFNVAFPPFGQQAKITLTTHGENQCGGEFCCLHNPSDHPLREAPLNWRADRIPAFMERICEHGVGHPDPDSLAWLRSVPAVIEKYGESLNASGVHGCDGCCRA